LKKYLLFLSIVCCSISLKSLAQNFRVPNSSFEIWDTLATLTVPDSWPSSDLLWYYEGYNTHNVYPDRHHHSGKYSAHIGPDTAAGKIWPGFIAAKFAIKTLPDYLSFYYIDSMNQAESGAVKISLLRWNKTQKTEDSIGGTTWNFPASTIKDFVPGQIPIDYTGIDTTTKPDSISITFEVVSSATSLASGHIAVDDVSLGSDSSGFAIPALVRDFEIFPNPTNSIVYIASQNPVRLYSKIEISDLNGQIIYSQYQDIGVSTPIDLSQDPPGMYIVKVFSGGRVSVNKIIISR